jgi:outer membrane protein assembly factor BamB
VVALDLQTGAELWRRTGGPVPRYGEGLVIVTNPGDCRVVDVLTGEDRAQWSTSPCATLIQNGTVYGFDSDSVFAIELATGSEQWRQPVDAGGLEFDLRSAGTEDLYLVAEVDDGLTLLAFDITARAERWRRQELPGEWGSMAGEAGFLYLALEADAPDLAGGLVVLDAATGETVASAELPVEAMVINTGVTYVGARDGVLHALGLDRATNS